MTEKIVLHSGEAEFLKLTLELNFSRPSPLYRVWNETWVLGIILDKEGGGWGWHMGD